MTRNPGIMEQERSADDLFYAARSCTTEQRKLFSRRKAERLSVGLLTSTNKSNHRSQP